MEQFIWRLPKAELHVHIEGTLEPELLFELAAKHRVTLPYASVHELRRAYEFPNLQSFLDLYFHGASVLCDEADFYALTARYLRTAHEQGVVHTEIFFDPQTHTARGIPFSTVLGGMRRALVEAKRELGMTHRLIPCFLRHLSVEDAQRTLDEVLEYRAYIAAVGLDSSEIGHPPSKFATVFARARAAGLGAVAHAGEEGPAAYISQALDLLHVQRIDHGVHCEEDPQLMERLRREAIPLTMCPLSNVKLKVFPDIGAHNLKRLLSQGLCVTVNSDDPAYFGGYIADNYQAVQRGLSLSSAELARLARNSIVASFLEPSAKQHWLTRIDEVAQDAPLS